MFLIRSATDADLPHLIPLCPSAGRARLRLRAAADGTETLLVAASDDGPVLGAVSVRWHSRCDPPHPWLYGLRVHEDRRGRGIGRALIAAAESAAATRGCAALSLDVDTDNEAAIGLYERLGYTTVTRHEHHWKAVDPDTGAVTATGSADCWIMRRTLRPFRQP